MWLVTNYNYILCNYIFAKTFHIQEDMGSNFSQLALLLNVHTTEACAVHTNCMSMQNMFI